MPIFEAGGAFRGYRGIAQDTTARTQAEQALKAGEARFRTLTELFADWYMRDVFWIYAPRRKRFDYVGASYESVWGSRGKRCTRTRSHFIGWACQKICR
jgi:PAS domain-containing protein